MTLDDRIEEYLASLGIAGRVALKDGFWRLTLDRPLFARIKVELPDDDKGSPSLARFIDHLRKAPSVRSSEGTLLSFHESEGLTAILKSGYSNAGRAATQAYRFLPRKTD